MRSQQQNPLLADRQLTKDERRRVAIYKDDPLAFVIHELGETPSPEQEQLLNDVADPDNLFDIICSGRGAGKTMVVSWIACWSAAVLTHFYPKYDISVLGGSKEQSLKLYTYVRRYISKTPLLEKRLLEEPLKSRTLFQNCELLTHAASSTSVRGSHVELLILDECAEIPQDIFNDALPMASGSHHGRIIMLSTPHKMYGEFQDVWDNHEEYHFTRYGPWPLSTCPWNDQRLLDMLKKKYTPEQYMVEVLGQFPVLGDKMFRREWIEGAVARDPFGYNPSFDVELGLDWGFYPSPTARVQVQYYNNKIQVPGPEKTWLGVDAVTIANELEDYSRTHRLNTIYADSSHRHMNEHLRKQQIRAEDVFFSTDKELMQINLQYLLSIGAINISPDNAQLIEQLKSYRVELVRRRVGKKDEDLVDALMLACKQFADEDLQNRYRTRAADQFHLR